MSNLCAISGYSGFFNVFRTTSRTAYIFPKTLKLVFTFPAHILYACYLVRVNVNINRRIYKTHVFNYLLIRNECSLLLSFLPG